MADSGTITIPIGGMSCKHCVASVTKALADIPGVTAVDVSLEKGQAVVSGNGLDVQALRSAIEDIGFDAGSPL